MLRRFRRADREDGGRRNDRSRDRLGRRRRPGVEGLEGRQLLSTVAPAPAPAALAQAAPVVEQVGHPVVVQHTSLPPVRAWAGRPFDGVVASFISNSEHSSAHLVASIDWGDGHVSPGTIEPSAWGGFNVRGAHVYAPNVSGPTWLRIDLADATTGQWVTGVEQRAMVSRTAPARFSGPAGPGALGPVVHFQPAERAQPARLRYVERRQDFHEAADRYVHGVASAEDIRYLQRVHTFIEQQNRSAWQKIGDNLWPF
jgi:hypothetical protein